MGEIQVTATPTFARARSDEQRAERREAILATAAGLLNGRRVADLSLNELSRQVGLAKSNVLRYFESREAILLELYDREFQAWLDELASRLAGQGTGHNSAAIEEVARAIADTAAKRPIFCELMASAASVLEHNVSRDVAVAYKRSALASSKRLTEIVGTRLGAFDDPSGILFAASVFLVIGGVWQTCQPSTGMAAAYAAHPELAAMRIDFSVAVRELVATMLAGLQQRSPDSRPG